MLAYLLGFIAGSLMGLLGGGGSVLTIPILVYLVGIPDKTAIAMSLAIVGFSTIPGILSYARKKMINYKAAAIFLPFSIVGTFLGVYIASFLSGKTQLILFSLILITISILMMLKKQGQQSKQNQFALFLSSLFAGVIIGIVGIGGGFMIVPILFLFAGIEMKEAVGTSLLIIGINSLIGFMKYSTVVEIDWSFLIAFILCSALGTLAGSHSSKFIKQDKLKNIFAYFVFSMGIFILYRNIIL